MISILKSIDSEKLLDFSIDKLTNLNTLISIELKNKLIKRFDERRTIFFYILNYLKLGKLDQNSYSEKTIKLEMKYLINRLFYEDIDKSISISSNNLSISDSSINSSKKNLSIFEE